MSDELKCMGVGRDAENDRAFVVCFNRPLSDRELRELHYHLRKGIPHNFYGPGACVCGHDPAKEYDDE